MSPENAEGRPREEAAPSREPAKSKDTSFFEAALNLAGRNWYVFRCRPQGKEPLWGCRWPQEATTDPARIEQWWEQWPDANIGIALGPSSLVVVDVDDPVVFKTAGLELPRTLTARTSRGGHFYYAAKSEIKGFEGPGCDVKTSGGYVLAPPSVHPSGSRYEWVDPDAPLAPVPEWVLQNATARAEWNIEGEFTPSPRTSRYGLVAVMSECRALATTPTGNRNHRLNRAAFAIGQLAAGGEVGMIDGSLDPAVVEKVIEAGLSCGLDYKEVVRTVRHAFEDGITKPRTRRVV